MAFGQRAIRPVTRLHLSWSLAFLLGGVLTLAALRLTPPLALGLEEPEELTLVIPALAEAVYTYRQTRGFLAVLETGDGRRLVLPSTWLPGEESMGGQFLIATQAQPGASETTFNVVFKPLATSERALPR